MRKRTSHSIAQVKQQKRFSESTLQKSCVYWYRLQYRKTWMLLFSVPNGAYLQGDSVARAKQWKRLKAEGAVEGVSDLFLAVSGPLGANGLFIEMKTEEGKQTDTQKLFERAVTEAGFGYEVCRSLEQFQDIVNQQYGAHS